MAGPDFFFTSDETKMLDLTHTHTHTHTHNVTNKQLTECKSNIYMK
jgi:hypothetical protein